MSDASNINVAAALGHARALAARAEDEAAKQAYLELLRLDSTHFEALNELGTLALDGGFRSAARSAYLRAVQYHPGNKIGHVNLANLLREDDDLAAAKLHYEMALAIDPQFPEAHQGMAWVLNQLGQQQDAEAHWHRGYSGHALVGRPYRGTGAGIPVLQLVSARGGNIPTRLWLNDRQFAVNTILAEFYEPDLALPPHALLVNAIGDADLSAAALDRAEDIVARSTAPVINQPARVRLTARIANAQRLADIEGVIAPSIRALSRAQLLSAADLRYPLLLRRAGFHNGKHFVYVRRREELAAAVASLEGDPLLVIGYLDARGADGLVRKYRVMFVDGVVYPLHLAISADWKVHYATSLMAHDPAYRDEERRFLENMPYVLGARAMAALERICARLGIEYAGIDFALAADGSLLMFEANATMIVIPPPLEAMWDYRREAVSRVLEAASAMLLRRARIRA